MYMKKNYLIPYKMQAIKENKLDPCNLISNKHYHKAYTHFKLSIYLKVKNINCLERDAVRTINKRMCKGTEE